MQRAPPARRAGASARSRAKKATRASAHVPRKKATSIPLHSDQSSAPTPSTIGARRYERASGAACRGAALPLEEEPPRGEERAEDAHRGDDRRPHHEMEIAEAGGVPEGEDEGVEEARVPRRVPVPLDPLEGVAARGGAGEVEVDEDVVERRRPLAPRLLEHVPVERARRGDGARRRPQGVERGVEALEESAEGAECFARQRRRAREFWCAYSAGSGRGEGVEGRPPQAPQPQAPHGHAHAGPRTPTPRTPARAPGPRTQAAAAYAHAFAHERSGA